MHTIYAIIKTGGKQYKVAEGMTLQIEKFAAEPGTHIDFNEVLLLASGNTIQVGKPSIEGGKVTATVQSQGRGEKIKIFKMRRRKHARRHQGHRQYYTEVKITGLFAHQQKIETPQTTA